MKAKVVQYQDNKNYGWKVYMPNGEVHLFPVPPVPRARTMAAKAQWDRVWEKQWEAAKRAAYEKAAS